MRSLKNRTTFRRLSTTLLGVGVLLNSAVVLAAELPLTITYQGRLYDSSSQPIETTVDLQLDVFSQDGSCLLYSETKQLDLSASDGFFSTQIGSVLGATSRTSGVDPGLSMQAVFDNSSAKTGASSCSYTPSARDGRKIQVTILKIGATTVNTVLSPKQNITSVPYATVAQTLQGKSADKFVQLTGSITQSDFEGLMAKKSELLNLAAQESTLLALAAGTSTTYLKSSMSGTNLSGVGDIAMSAGKSLQLGTFTTNEQNSLVSSFTSADIGTTWYNSDTNKLMYYNGSGAQVVATGGGGGSGTVTDVTGTAPIVVATGTTTPAVSLNYGTGLTVTSNQLVPDFGTASGKVAQGNDARFNPTITGAGDANKLVKVNSGGTAYEFVSTSALGIDSANSRVGVGTGSPSVSLDIGSKTDAVRLPSGTTAQRPSSPANGDIRYNTTTSTLESYVNGGWQAMAAASSIVDNSSSQSIAGTKTFSDATTFSAAGPSAALDVTGAGGLQTTVLNVTGNSTLAGNVNVNSGKFFVDATNAKVGIGTAAPTNDLSLSGQAAKTVGMERHSTADTAGNDLTLASGGAASGATDKNGGKLVLSSGTSTGTGASSIEFKTATPGSAGSSDNAPSTKMVVTGDGKVGIGTTNPTGTFVVDGGTASGGAGSTISMTAQAAGGSEGLGGSITLTAGNSYATSSNFAGGSITLLGGQGAATTLSGSNGTGGTVTVQGGAGGTSFGRGGPVTIKGGVATEGIGGAVSLVGGDGASATATARNGGGISFTPGAAVNGGSSGAVNFNSPSSYSSGSGEVTLLNANMYFTGANSDGSGARNKITTRYMGSDTVENLTALALFTRNQGGGTVNHNRLLWLQNSAPSSSTTTNQYGVFIDGMAGSGITNSYGIYQNGSSDINYFAGNVGIGTSSPAVSLDISGKTDAIRLPAGTTAQRPTAAAGLLRYNSDDNVMEAYVNGAWRAVATAATAVDLSSSQTIAGTKTYSDTTTFSATGPSVALDVTGTGGMQTTLLNVTGATTMAGNLNVNSGKFFADATSGNVGVGTASPISKMHINSNTTAIPGYTPGTETALTVSGADGTGSRIQTFAFGNGSNTLHFNYAAGSAAAPLYPTTLSSLGSITWRGWNENTSTWLSGATISAQPDQNWDATTRNTALRFHTVSGTTSAEKMRISSSGYVGIGTTTPSASLDVTGQIRSASTNLSGGSSVNWHNGNIQYTGTGNGCQAFTLNNMLDGASYTLIVNGTSGTCSFTAYSGNGSGSLTVNYPDATAPSAITAKTVYTFIRAGSDVFVQWVSF